MGRAAAEEQIADIMACLEGSDMLFVTAGMGGGTGTGAAPVIARAARESGILTVGVVTKPFHFEGGNRMRMAEAGIAELQQYVDTLIVIPNQNLFRIANERTTFAEAFRLADEVLHSGVRGITDLMVMPGFMNLDFADVSTVMGEMGKAMMGTGEAEGENRAIRAAEAAISNPLLDDVSMKGARGVLINITGGLDMTLFEVDQAANRIREEVDPEAQIKVGSTLGENLDGRIRVSVIATGIDAAVAARAAQGSTGVSTAAIAPRPAVKTAVNPFYTPRPAAQPTGRDTVGHVADQLFHHAAIDDIRAASGNNAGRKGLILCCSICGALSLQAQLFSDDFTRGTDPGPLPPWTTNADGGDWTVTGGVLIGGPNTLPSYGDLYITNSWDDYSVQAQFQFPVGAFGGGLGGRLNPATGAHYGHGYTRRTPPADRVC